jgi:ketosteroid isomerase-like protein
MELNLMKYAFEISDVRGGYLRDRDFRRFAGAPLRLLVTGFVALAASNNWAKYLSTGALFLLIVCNPSASPARTAAADAELKLVPCGHVFVAQAKVDGIDRTFVIDTGSTTMMNVQTFSDVHSLAQPESYLTTFMGRRPVPARVVVINEVEFGDRKLYNIKVPAVDLSMTKLFCGKQFDGVVGTDLLAKLDVRIDFVAGVAIVPAAIEDVGREIKSELHGWEEAFDHRDLTRFNEMFSSDIVWVTPRFRLNGREDVIAYLQREYFEHNARMKSGHIDVSRSSADVRSYRIRWEYKLNVGNGWTDYRASAIAHQRDKGWEILSVDERTASETPQADSAIQR